VEEHLARRIGGFLQYEKKEKTNAKNHDLEKKRLEQEGPSVELGETTYSIRL